jgi:hypothetical protein
MKTNEAIFAEIREQGYITEAQIKLLKNRSNREQTNVFKEYGSVKDGIRVTSDQGQKGLIYLYRVVKSRNCPLGNREKIIIANAIASNFRFMGFRNCNDGSYLDFQPVYKVETSGGNMTYHVSGGAIHVTN